MYFFRALIFFPEAPLLTAFNPLRYIMAICKDTSHLKFKIIALLYMQCSACFVIR